MLVKVYDPAKFNWGIAWIKLFLPQANTFNVIKKNIKVNIIYLIFKCCKFSSGGEYQNQRFRKKKLIIYCHRKYLFLLN